MILPNIETLEQVTDDQVAYLAGLAQTLATQNDFSIQNFADSAVTSPDVQSSLQVQSAVSLLEDVPPQGAAFDIFNPAGNTIEMFALSLPQEHSIFPGLGDKLKKLFSSLRRKVKRIFCKVVAKLQTEDLDLKNIIRQVLLVLIPSFAASTGLIPIALPIVISLAAMLFKYSVAKVCPV